MPRTWLRLRRVDLLQDSQFNPQQGPLTHRHPSLAVIKRLYWVEETVIWFGKIFRNYTLLFMVIISYQGEKWTWGVTKVNRSRQSLLFSIYLWWPWPFCRVQYPGIANIFFLHFRWFEWGRDEMKIPFGRVQWPLIVIRSILLLWANSQWTCPDDRS